MEHVAAVQHCLSWVQHTCEDAGPAELAAPFGVDFWNDVLLHASIAGCATMLATVTIRSSGAQRLLSANGSAKLLLKSRASQI